MYSFLRFGVLFVRSDDLAVRLRFDSDGVQAYKSTAYTRTQHSLSQDGVFFLFFNLIPVGTGKVFVKFVCGPPVPPLVQPYRLSGPMVCSATGLNTNKQFYEGLRVRPFLFILCLPRQADFVFHLSQSYPDTRLPELHPQMPPQNLRLSRLNDKESPSMSGKEYLVAFISVTFRRLTRFLFL